MRCAKSRAEMGKIMKDNKGFWNRWAKRYDLMMSGDGRIYAWIVSRMKKVLDRDMTVLELACGTGLLSVRLAGSVKLLEATDFSEEMIRQAKAKTHSSRLHFSVQDATSLPYAEETFDAASSISGRMRIRFMELSRVKVYHKWTPQEYLDFLKENGVVRCL